MDVPKQRVRQGDVDRLAPLAATPSRAYSVSGWSPTVGFNGSTSATTVVPGNDAGPLNVDVSASWDNGFYNTDFGSVDLGSGVRTAADHHHPDHPAGHSDDAAGHSDDRGAAADRHDTDDRGAAADGYDPDDGSSADDEGCRHDGRRDDHTAEALDHDDRAGDGHDGGSRGWRAPDRLDQAHRHEGAAFTGSSSVYVIFFGLSTVRGAAARCYCTSAARCRCTRGP